MNLWPHRRPSVPRSGESVHPESIRETIDRVELVYTTDELGGLESRLRAALDVRSTGTLRTPATLANAVREVTIRAGGESRVEVHRRPAALRAAESWEVCLWNVPGRAREPLSTVLGRTL